ncbi:MAG: GNVR domain-containing protein [Candidatus Omnitrophota bacterium]
MSGSRHAEISPMNYLKVFFRRKEYLVIPVFIGLILGVCAGIILPKKFKSSTILLVEDGKSDNPLFDNIAVSTTVNQRLATIRESLLGWNSLVELVKRLNMDKEVKTPQELENLILGIRDKIDIKLRGRNIIDLSYVGSTPEKTQAVVKNITEIFIESNVQIQNEETADAIKFIEEQLKVYRGKIKSAEIVELRDNLNALLVDSTERHPRVRELKEQIKAKELELERENLEFSESAALDTTTTRPIIEEIRRALDNIDGGANSSVAISKADPKGLDKDTYKLFLLDKLDDVLARDVAVNNQIYNTLLQRAETAKITQRLQSSKEGTKYTVLDPPRMPLKPIRPNKTLVALAGVCAGMMFGVVLVFGLEFLDKSFIDVEDANRFFGTPLLGAISRINTEASIRKERERLSWLYSLVLLGGIIAIVVTTALSTVIL